MTLVTMATQEKWENQTKKLMCLMNTNLKGHENETKTKHDWIFVKMTPPPVRRNPVMWREVGGGLRGGRGDGKVMVSRNSGGMVTGGQQNPGGNGGWCPLMPTQSMAVTTAHCRVKGKSQGVEWADNMTEMEPTDPRAQTERRWTGVTPLSLET